MDWGIILIVVAGVLAVIELISSGGKDRMAWATLALVAAALL